MGIDEDAAPHDVELAPEASPGPELSHGFEVAADESPSTAVVRAVSATSGTAVDELGQLYEEIDPDALDKLLDGSRTERSVGVRFTYAGYRVQLDADGRGRIVAAR